MIRICFHGAESTGKSVLAAQLGYPWVPEYGRAYCEERGTDLTMADLLAIAAGQDRAMKAAMNLPSSSGEGPGVGRVCVAQSLDDNPTPTPPLKRRGLEKC